MPKIQIPTLDAMTTMLSESGYEGGDVSKLLEKLKGVSGRRGASGYMLWLNENREKIKTDYFGDTLMGREKVTMIAKKGGELWGEMDEAEKEEWNSKARENRGSVAPKAKKVAWTYSCAVDDDAETPEDMSGPFVGYALVGKTSMGYVRGKGSFSKLSDALEAAREVEGCVGVTKGEGGYQLRSQERLVAVTKEYFRDHVKSWVFGEKSVEDMIGKKKEGSGKKKVAKILKKVAESVPKKVTKKVAKKVPKKAATEEMEELKKKMAELAKKAAEESEVEEEAEEEVEEEVEEEAEEEVENNDEESEDEEVELETWIFDEEEFWVDPSTNEVYNGEQKVIGHRVEKDGHYMLKA